MKRLTAFGKISILAIVLALAISLVFTNFARAESALILTDVSDSYSLGSYVQDLRKIPNHTPPVGAFRPESPY